MIPLSGGNVAYLTLFNRPGKKNFDQYPELQEWVTVTALRFNFDRLNTFGDEVFGDPKVLKSYYIAVSDIAVGGKSFILYFLSILKFELSSLCIGDFFLNYVQRGFEFPNQIFWFNFLIKLPG